MKKGNLVVSADQQMHLQIVKAEFLVMPMITEDAR
jgi:hypothetical protein